MIQKIKKITAEAQRHRGKANLLLTAPQARLTITKCFSRRLCASAVQSFEFVSNVSSWLKTEVKQAPKPTFKLFQRTHILIYCQHNLTLFHLYLTTQKT
jgi:hypothetical protein